jgi:hypothetical protein
MPSIQIQPKLVIELAGLAKLDLEPDRMEQMVGELGKILGYVEDLYQESAAQETLLLPSSEKEPSGQSVQPVDPSVMLELLLPGLNAETRLVSIPVMRGGL